MQGRKRKLGADGAGGSPLTKDAEPLGGGGGGLSQAGIRKGRLVRGGLGNIRHYIPEALLVWTVYLQAKKWGGIEQGGDGVWGCPPTSGAGCGKEG